MQKYINSAFSSRPVMPLKGAEVTVTTSNGDLATLYSDNAGTLMGNPIYTDDSGNYSFYAADGRYTVTISKTGFQTQIISDVLLEDAIAGSAALASSSGSALVGYAPGSTASAARTLQSKLRESVSILDFIPETEHAAIFNRTSTYDCADAIEAAQEYLSPFAWLGTVAATKAAISGGASRLNFPGGLYVIKRPVKLNPYIQFSGPFTAFFFAKSGAEIRADFDGHDLAALDTAPWDSTGQRQLGKTWLSTDFDSGTITGSMGQRLRNMRITCAPGRNIKAGINATGAAPFFLDQSTVDGFNVGVLLSCSWVGHLSGCFIKARAIGVWAAEGVNHFKSWGNYLGPTGTKPTTLEFDWPTTPVSGYDQSTRAFYMNQGYITSDSDEMESWNVAGMATQCTSFRFVNSYLEAIGNTCFVLHDTKAYIQPSKINCSAAKLYDTIGKNKLKEVTFDFSSMRIGSLNVLDGTSSTTGIVITGSPAVTVPAAGVVVPEFDHPNTLNIYVDRTNGNDLYSGYQAGYPVKELMTALGRCKKGCVNVVNVTGDVITNTVNSNDWATFFSDLDIRFVKTGASSTIYLKYDSTTSRMIPLPFKNCNLEFTGFQFLDDVPGTTVAAGYNAAFNLAGLNRIRLNGCTLKTAKSMFQSSRFSAAKLDLFIESSTLRSYDGTTNTNLIETDTTYTGKLVWVQVGYQVTKTAVVVGSNANNIKIAATDF